MDKNQLLLESIRREFIAVTEGQTKALEARFDAFKEDTHEIRAAVLALGERTGKSELSIGRLKLVNYIVGSVSLVVLAGLIKFAGDFLLKMSVLTAFVGAHS